MTLRNPLDLTAELRNGRALLSTRDVAIGPWFLVERLVLEVPPFADLADLAELARLRLTISQLRVSVDESSLSQTLTRMLAGANRKLGIDDVSLRFSQGLIHVLVCGHDAGQRFTLTCVLTVHAGPLSGSPHELVLVVQETLVFQRLSRHPQSILANLFSVFAQVLGGLEESWAASWWQVPDDGRSLWLSPLRLAFAEAFATRGWKIPALPQGVHFRASVGDGRLMLEADTPTYSDFERSPSGAESAGFDATKGRPLAAEQATLSRWYLLDESGASQLTQSVDAAIRAHREATALNQCRRSIDELGLHPALLERMGYLLLLEEDGRAELEDLCRRARDGGIVLLSGLLDALASDGAVKARKLQTTLEQLPTRGRELERVCILLELAQAEANEHPQRAVTHLREALREKNDFKPALLCLAGVYAKTAQYDVQIEVLKRASKLEADPIRRGVLLTELAETIFLGVNDARGAANVLNRAKELAEANPTSLIRVAEGFLRIGDVQSAVKVSSAAAALLERDGSGERAAELYTRVARFWLELGDVPNARLACKSALRVSPNHASATLTLARSYRSKEDASKGVEMLETLIESLEFGARNRGPSNGPQGDAPAVSILADCFGTLAELNILLGDDAQTLLAYRRMLSLSPSSAKAFDWLEDHFHNAGRYEELVDILQLRVEHLDDRDLIRDHLLTLSRIYDDHLDLPSDALKFLEKAAQLAPLTKPTFNRYIELLERTQSSFELREALEKQVELIVEPIERAALFARLGRLNLDSLKDANQACAVLRRAVALQPSDRGHLLELRRALWAAGLHDDLPNVLERIATLTDDLAAKRPLLIEAGDVLFEHLERPHRALRFYQRALEIAADPVLETRVARIQGTPPAQFAEEGLEAPHNGPPTDIGAIVEDAPKPALRERRDTLATNEVESGTRANSDSWEEASAVSKASESAESSLPDPISEEIEVTLLSAQRGGVGLRLVSSEVEGYADIPELPAEQNKWEYRKFSMAPETNPERPSVIDRPGGEEPKAEKTTLASGSIVSEVQEKTAHPAAASSSSAQQEEKTVLATWPRGSLGAKQDQPTLGLGPLPTKAEPTVIATGPLQLQHGSPAAGTALAPRVAGETPQDQTALPSGPYPTIASAGIPAYSLRGSAAPESERNPIDHADPEFTLPSAQEAPDWREMARRWTAASTKIGPSVDLGPSHPLEPPSFDERDHDENEDSDELYERPLSDDHSLDPLVKRVEQARRSGDTAALVDALEGLGDKQLRTAERARVFQEIGCLAYFELEDVEKAKTFLERACVYDPDGVGVEDETLTALEGIYEDLKDYGSLLNVYQRKLARCEVVEMMRVYRLLIAQLAHEKLGDHLLARRQLEIVLAREPQHVPALKLIVDVERSLNNPTLAANHLQQLITVVGDEDEQTPFRLLLPEIFREAGDTELARKHYWLLIGSGKASGAVLDRLKGLCRESDDWTGLIDCLLFELSTLTKDLFQSRTLEGLSAFSSKQIPPHLTVVVSQLLREMADILSLKLEAQEEAWELYRKVLDLLPEDPYVLERFIDLARRLQHWNALSNALVRLSSILLDPLLQFEALYEAALVNKGLIADPLRAKSLLERALAPFGNQDAQRPKGFQEARELLDALNAAVVVRFSFGSSTERHTPPRSALVSAEEIQDAVFDPFSKTEVKARIQAIENAFEKSQNREERVALLTEKGVVLSRYPETQRDAIISLRAALALDPNYVPARLSLIDGLLANGEVEQALNHLVVLSQRAKPDHLDAANVAEMRNMVDIIVATGQPSVISRANNLIKLLQTL
ncbi:MAG: hypothetical protein CO108_19235 [Deltaproteobacteria bacterium CG_4_9_14_3_um_filter_63_12]|nr:MAG: hypothetical protein CO108_19235 [Deltaproteobacteria bacterium CG_4_9_14_3_um_filter_63_12]